MQIHYKRKLLGPALISMLVFPSLLLSKADSRTPKPEVANFFSVHDSPKRMVERFVNTLREHPAEDLATAFEGMRQELKLKKQLPTVGDELNAEWSNSDHSRRFVLLGGHQLGSNPTSPDHDKRFHLTLLWNFTQQPLLLKDLENLVGPVFGTNERSFRTSWILGGGLFSVFSPNPSSVTYESPAYIKDPLDFLEAVNLQKLPDSQSVETILQNSSLFSFAETTTDLGRSREFCFTNMTTSPEHISKCVIRFVGDNMGQRHLVGLLMRVMGPGRSITPKEEYASMFQRLGVPNAQALVDGIFSALPSAESSQDPLLDFKRSVYQSGNFSVVRIQQDPRRDRRDAPPIDLRIEQIYVWRRIELPPEWRRLVRPDIL